MGFLLEIYNSQESTAPVEIYKCGKLVNLDGSLEPGKVDGVNLLLDEGQVVPDVAGVDNLILVSASQQALRK